MGFVPWLFIFFGSLFLAGAVFNWSWVFEVSRLRFVTLIFGEKVGRIVYFIFGVFFLIAGTIALMQTGKK